MKTVEEYFSEQGIENIDNSHPRVKKFISLVVYAIKHGYISFAETFADGEESVVIAERFNRGFVYYCRSYFNKTCRFWSGILCKYNKRVTAEKNKRASLIGIGSDNKVRIKKSLNWNLNYLLGLFFLLLGSSLGLLFWGVDVFPWATPFNVIVSIFVGILALPTLFFISIIGLSSATVFRDGFQKYKIKGLVCDGELLIDLDSAPEGIKSRLHSEIFLRTSC